MLGPKLKSNIKKIGIKTTFTYARNLKNLICKSNLLPNTLSRFYELDFTGNALYINEAKNKYGFHWGDRKQQEYFNRN